MKALSSSSEVDGELAKLKSELGTGQAAGELSAGDSQPAATESQSAASGSEAAAPEQGQ